MASLLCGLSQKRTIAHAWDVQATMLQIKALLKASSDEELAGQTLILLRQVYATRGQAVVGRMAIDMASSGRRWGAASMRRLSRELKILCADDARKTRGRGVLFSGTRWIDSFLGGASASRAFRRAAKAIGRVLVASSPEECSAFGTLCQELLGPGKLPGVAKYGAVGLARAAFISAPGYEPSWVGMDEHVWGTYLQRMSMGTVAPTFASMEVPDLAAAFEMLSALRMSLSKHHGFRLGVFTNRMALIDLPCIVCEHAQVLDAVIKADVGIHDRGAAVPWVLGNLPTTEREVRRLAKKLRIRTQLHPRRGDGMDRQCGHCVASDWIRNVVKASPKALAITPTQREKRAASTERLMARLSGPALQRRCSSCGGSSVGEKTYRPRRRGETKICRECYQALRRAKDASRKRAMRRRTC